MKHLRFSNVTSTYAKFLDMRWPEFINSLSPLDINSKDKAPLFLAAETRPNPVTGNYGRKKSDILKRTMLVVDYDQNVPPDIFEIFKQKLMGTAYYAYTTFNHGVEGQTRCRLIVPLVEPVDPDIFEILTGQLINKIGIQADPCTNKASQLMYYPIKTPNFQFSEGSGEFYPINCTVNAQNTDQVQKYKLPNPIGQIYFPDIRQLLDNHLLHVYKKGRDATRYTYLAGHGTDGLEIGQGRAAWEVRSYHTSDPLYGLGWVGAYEVVKTHICNNNDDATMSWFTQGDPTTSIEYVKKLFYRSKDGRRDYSLESDVRLALKYDIALKGLMYVDAFSKDIMLTRRQKLLDSEIVHTENQGRLSDSDLDLIISYLIDTYRFKLSDSRLTRIIYTHATSDKRHKSKEFIERAKWDGIDRFKDMPERAGFEVNAFTRDAVKKWMVATVSMIYNSQSTKFDSMLIFHGYMGGEGKTSLCEMLGGTPELTAELDAGAFAGASDHKDIFIKLIGSMVSYFDEFQQMTGRAAMALKTLVTRDNIKFRTPYDRKERLYRREFGLCAASTQQYLFFDPQERRRLWVVPITGKVKKSADKYEYFTKCVGDPYFRQQLWAHALELYRHGYKFDLTIAEDDMREEILERHRRVGKYEDKLLRYLETQNTPLKGVGICVDIFLFDEGVLLSDINYDRHFSGTVRQLNAIGFSPKVMEVEIAGVKKRLKVFVKNT